MENLTSIFNYFWLKIALTIPAVFFCPEGSTRIIILLLLIVVIDTILGVSVALKHKTFSSCGLGKASKKISLYGMALATAYLLSISDPMLEPVFKYFGVFFIFNEAFSNFEKLALLGLPLPVKLLAKINKDFQKLYMGEKKATDIVEKKKCR